MSSEQDRPNQPQRRHVRRTRPRRGGQPVVPPTPTEAAETPAPLERPSAPPPADEPQAEDVLKAVFDHEEIEVEFGPEPERDWLAAGLAIMVMIGLLICAGVVLIAAGKN